MSKRQIHVTISCCDEAQRDKIQKLVLEAKLFSHVKITSPQAVTYALMRYVDFLKAKESDEEGQRASARIEKVEGGNGEDLCTDSQRRLGHGRHS